MIPEFHFHFNEHPAIGFCLMVVFLTSTVLVKFAELGHGLALVLQIAAYCMTIFVGYKTLKKLDKN